MRLQNPQSHGPHDPMGPDGGRGFLLKTSEKIYIPQEDQRRVRTAAITSYKAFLRGEQYVSEALPFEGSGGTACQ